MPPTIAPAAEYPSVYIGDPQLVEEPDLIPPPPIPEPEAESNPAAEVIEPIKPVDWRALHYIPSSEDDQHDLGDEQSFMCHDLSIPLVRMHSGAEPGPLPGYTYIHQADGTSNF